MMRLTMTFGRTGLLLGLTWAWFAPSWAGAQDEDSQAVDAQIGLHVVRPGDTLEDLSEFYSGNRSLWQENWRLNPDLADANVITPQQRLRILLTDRLPASTALLFASSRRVEDRLLPHDWDVAQERDLLKGGGGLRTTGGGSAALLFADGTELYVNVQSVVFLDRGPAATPRVQRRLIEVEVGQADLESRGPASRGPSPEIEIVMGKAGQADAARARPRPTADGEIRTRARRREAGPAQLMVYKGESDLEAAGQGVTVAEGMGSTVPPGDPPLPPEELLEAPEALQPAAGSRWNTSAPEFRWGPVHGARSYVLEVCQDPRCGRLVERVADLETAPWRPTRLPVAPLYWRITAVSDSGLDGYPSDAVPFTILSDVVDRVPPRVELRFVGPQFRAGDELVVGPGVALVVEASDQESGIREWRPVLDGVEVSSEAWQGPFSHGPHTAAVIAVDRAGNETRLEAVKFFYDSTPPAVRWGAAGGRSEVEMGRVVGSQGAAGSQELPWGGRGEALEWSPDSQRWFPLGRQDWRYFADKPWLVVYEKRGARRTAPQNRRHLLQGKEKSRTVRVDFAGPRFTIRGPKKGLRLGGVDLVLSRSQGLWIEAVEEVCRVEKMTFRVTERQGRQFLSLQAVDAVGNQTQLAWPLLGADSEP